MLAIDKGALERQIDEAGDDVVLPDRDLAQDQRLGRGRLQHRHDVAHARFGLVDLVDEQEMRDAAILELLEDQLQRRHLLLVGLADDDRGVAGGERVRRVGLEFDRAGAIEEGEAVAEEIDGGDVELDAHAVCRASSEASPTVLPPAIEPWRVMAPVRASMASRSVVFPLR